MSDNLPQEVVFDILARLLVKSLLQMRCVCKSWNSLINSPNFITSHTNQTLANNNNELVLLRHHTDGKDQFTVHCNNNTFNECTTFDCPFTNWTKYYLRVVGLCDGLVCLSSYDQTTILWNPSIKRCLNLPTPHITYKSHSSYTFILGFGFDSLTNGFKVVRLVYFHKNFGYRLPVEVDVYMLSIGTWRTVNTVTPSYNLMQCVSHAFVNRACHWIGFEAMTKEISDWGYPSKDCDIWVMTEYGVVESWTKLFTIDFGISKAVGFRKNGEFLAEDSEGKLVTYDFKMGQIVYLGIHGLKQSFHLDNYMESLVLLIEGNEVLEEKAKSSNALDKGIEERSELGSSINQQGSGSRGRLIASVAVYEESICLFHYDRDWGYPSKNCDIWVMKEYGVVESWTKLFTIDFGISKAVEGNEVLEEKAKSSNALDKGIEERSELGSSINQQGSGSRGRFFCCAMPGSLTKTGLPQPSYRNLIDRPLQLERSLSQSTMLEEAKNNRKL
ncbi:hypothetical protein TEA_011496 [Camellia sinensis var. sinensis]|uniref:F-box domain-containing protein n=1 Tax=Camellia sinensis var. sinensis TaxID=542762 RepID=A0A4S4EWV9_CAMSN|nr:hypothetical protein TEA_011496 [Camellia sinensis var. sinensis]